MPEQTCQHPTDRCATCGHFLHEHVESAAGTLSGHEGVWWFCPACETPVYCPHCGTDTGEVQGDGTHTTEPFAAPCGKPLVPLSGYSGITWRCPDHGEAVTA